MSSSDSCKDGASIKSNDDVEMIGKLQNMSTTDKDDISVCANCGKDGANNICNKCQVTKYCNAVCKKVHKKKHKKDCEDHVRLAAEKHNEELKRAAELHDIELFKQPPPLEDCPICFLRMPILSTGVYKTCCGKVICIGCCYAPVYDDQGNEVDNEKCPFCRTPTPKSQKEMINGYKKRMELDDPAAMYNLGSYYRDGLYGLPQDYTKALELCHRAAKLGYAEAYTSIGYSYDIGRGVEVDKKKAIHYYELAAMGGEPGARHNLGRKEVKEADNAERALRHWMIAVRGGYSDSLKGIQVLYEKGYAAKEDYTQALQAYQEYLGEIKSDQRDKIAAADEAYRYY